MRKIIEVFLVSSLLAVWGGSEALGALLTSGSSGSKSRTLQNLRRSKTALLSNTSPPPTSWAGGLDEAQKKERCVWVRSIWDAFSDVGNSDDSGWDRFLSELEKKEKVRSFWDAFSDAGNSDDSGWDRFLSELEKREKKALLENWRDQKSQSERELALDSQAHSEQSTDSLMPMAEELEHDHLLALLGAEEKAPEGSGKIEIFLLAPQMKGELPEWGYDNGNDEEEDVIHFAGLTFLGVKRNGATIKDNIKQSLLGSFHRYRASLLYSIPGKFILGMQKDPKILPLLRNYMKRGRPIDSVGPIALSVYQLFDQQYPGPPGREQAIADVVFVSEEYKGITRQQIQDLISSPCEIRYYSDLDRAEKALIRLSEEFEDFKADQPNRVNKRRSLAQKMAYLDGLYQIFIAEPECKKE
ncbi:MAG: hypothetical protein ACO3A2_07125 [Bdellovibrionia bacterium]